MDDWKPYSFLLGQTDYFQGRTVSFKEGLIGGQLRFSKFMSEMSKICDSEVVQNSDRLGSLETYRIPLSNLRKIWRIKYSNGAKSKKYQENSPRFMAPKQPLEYFFSKKKLLYTAYSYRYAPFRSGIFQNIPSKIEWDLTNGPLSKLLDL